MQIKNLTPSEALDAFTQVIPRKTRLSPIRQPLKNLNVGEGMTVEPTPHYRDYNSLRGSVLSIAERLGYIVDVGKLPGEVALIIRKS